MMLIMQIMLSVQNILSHCLGVFLVHFLLSSMIFSFNMASSQKHPISGQPGPGVLTLSLDSTGNEKVSDLQTNFISNPDVPSKRPSVDGVKCLLDVQVHNRHKKAGALPKRGSKRKMPQIMLIYTKSKNTPPETNWQKRIYNDFDSRLSRTLQSQCPSSPGRSSSWSPCPSQPWQLCFCRPLGERSW